MSEKFSRKHFLVLPSYQIRLVGFLIALLFIGSVLHGFFLYRITAKSVEDGFLSTHNRLRSTWEILKPAIVLTDGLSFVLLSLAFLTISIFISHRLIGPLFKIVNRLKEITSGNLGLPPIQLRKGDEGQLLSDAVNNLQKKYRERFSSLVRLQKRLNSENPPSGPEIRAILETALADLQVGEGGEPPV